MVFVCKGPSINDIAPKGEGGGYPQKAMRDDQGEVPHFKQR